MFIMFIMLGPIGAFSAKMSIAKLLLGGESSPKTIAYPVALVRFTMLKRAHRTPWEAVLSIISPNCAIDTGSDCRSEGDIYSTNLNGWAVEPDVLSAIEVIP